MLISDFIVKLLIIVEVCIVVIYVVVVSLIWCGESDWVYIIFIFIVVDRIKV